MNVRLRRYNCLDAPQIIYQTTKSPFSNGANDCFVAWMAEGGEICALYLSDNLSQSLAMLQKSWPNAKLHQTTNAQEYGTNLFDDKSEFTVILRLSDFRFKVLEALVTIPFGQIVSYSTLAEMSNCRSAVRAAASAVANNPVSFIIPCHRVVRNDGKIGQYLWGEKLKLQILNWESKTLALNCKN